MESNRKTPPTVGGFIDTPAEWAYINRHFHLSRGVSMIEPDKLATALTYDDVMLVPQKSEVLPKETDVSTHLTPSLKLNIPILSAAMDTVTEARLAIALAQEGGLGIIHKNCTIAQQAGEVDKVKRSEAGMIKDPDHPRPRQDRRGRSGNHEALPHLGDPHRKG